MKVKFDEMPFNLNETTVGALKIFMILYLKNLRDSGNFDNDYWTWGLAEINDFSSSIPISFTWGGDEDLPTKEFSENEVYVHI